MVVSNKRDEWKHDSYIHTAQMAETQTAFAHATVQQSIGRIRERGAQILDAWDDWLGVAVVHTDHRQEVTTKQEESNCREQAEQGNEATLKSYERPGLTRYHPFNANSN